LLQITRHYVSIKQEGGGARRQRRVHYRMCGKGPPLLMMHQSPRSSAEYIPLMQQWGQYFTCIAPDIPGFGHSDPLADPLQLQQPELDDFAIALLEFCNAAGLPPLPAYGFHSGGIMLASTLKHDPARFTALALGGYAIWDDADRAKIGADYVPPNPPKPYGEHLVWLWNRILEQSWYFPWYEPRDAARLPGAHDDVARIDSIIQDLLDSGDHYATGYAAVLRGKRDIPAPGSSTPPVRITAYTGDPLKDHLNRLGEMPANWESYGVDTPADHQAASLEFLLAHRAAHSAEPLYIAQDDDAGFLPVKTASFAGHIHWRGPKGATCLRLHAPGKSAELLQDEGAICIDMPGHGLSDRWAAQPPTDWAAWQAVIDAVAEHFGTSDIAIDPLPIGDPEQLYPDLSPDRFGHYLVRAWAIVRAGHIFAPWYAANAAHAIRIDEAALIPEKLVLEHRALIRAPAAKAYHIALQTHRRD
jgi:pimeloyl-ACP methyl ester carboxylesterase